MDIAYSLHDARVEYKNGILVVANHFLERRWRWTGNGFVTTQVKSTSEGQESLWMHDGNTYSCDWQLPGQDEPLEAELLDVHAEEGTDDGFTAKHLCVIATIRYPSVRMMVRYTIWVYPEGPGLRVQLSAKALDQFDPANLKGLYPNFKRVDFLPIQFGTCKRRMFGYYNETQQRNSTCEDILKEEVETYPLSHREFHPWPSAFCVEGERGGIAVVQESHKCPNQMGYDCGLFVEDAANGLSTFGWGMRPTEIRETWSEAWAIWMLVYDGRDLGREIAFKRFDALRYPFHDDRDVYMQANTWGSSDGGQGSRKAAIESEVLKELDSCADLGIDVLQIDDGWQVPPGHHTWIPEEKDGWYTHPASYPTGWDQVKARSDELGVRLGLWAAAQSVSLKELIDNYESGGFETFKLDYANVRNQLARKELMDKVRAFIKHTGHKVRVNWDVTENERRYGYFFAREYGCLFLANRKPVIPPETTYRPHTMLRDLWQLSQYINLRKIQGSVQNVDMVNRQLSDAGLHPQDYCVATVLMSTPLFFQQTYLYSDSARAAIKPLLAVYRTHRNNIFRGTVYPIGAKPNNYAWTGFQNHDDESGTGYLLIFRELNNSEDTATIRLHFLAGRKLDLTNLMTGEHSCMSCKDDGSLRFGGVPQAGYLFLQYA
jgi:hypothetical protein